MLLRNEHQQGSIVKLPLIAILILFALLPALALRTNPYNYERGAIEDQGMIAERNSNAIAVLLGEIRTNLSDLMFVKTERYLHGGIAYGAHLDYEEMAKSGEIKDKEGNGDHAEDGHDDHGDDDHDHDHDHPEASPYEAEEEEEGHVATLIPDTTTDFRGPIGQLHRRVKPWQDPSKPHVHSTGEELLPWYRLMTISNPKNVRAYLIGSWWLKTKGEDKYMQEALNFLTEGIQENPRAYQLYLMRGYVYTDLGEDEKALEQYRAGAELVDDVRPENGLENPRWTDYQEDDARAVARLAVIMESRVGSKSEALEMARRYNEVLGGDARLEANIQKLQGELLSTE